MTLDLNDSKRRHCFSDKRAGLLVVASYHSQYCCLLLPVGCAELLKRVHAFCKLLLLLLLLFFLGLDGLVQVEDNVQIQLHFLASLQAAKLLVWHSLHTFCRHVSHHVSIGCTKCFLQWTDGDAAEGNDAKATT